jgi:hypothetical protein
VEDFQSGLSKMREALSDVYALLRVLDPGFEASYLVDADGAAAPRLSAALRDPRLCGPTLFFLGSVDTRYTLLAIPELVYLATLHGYATLVREVLGRIPYREAESHVPAAVWHELDKQDDEDTYMCLAALLEYLGLIDALRQLCDRALRSDDPEVREVGESYHPDVIVPDASGD